MLTIKEKEPSLMLVPPNYQHHSENKRSLEFTFLWVCACVLEHKSVVNMLDVKLLQVRK